MPVEPAVIETTEGATTSDSESGAVETATGLVAPPAWSEEEMAGGSFKESKESPEGKTDTGSPDSEKEKKDKSTVPESDGESDENQADEGKNDDAENDKPQGDEGKPPKGYVEVTALKAQKNAVKYFKSKVSEAEATIADLQKQLAEKPTVEQENELKNFQELSDDEIDELADDDPAAAAKYVKDLRQFKKMQDRSKKEAKALEAQKEEEAINLHAANERITNALSVDGESIADDLGKFAVENGFPQELFELTDPNTRIVVDGKERALGENAATMVEFLAAMMAGPEKEAITVDNVPDDVRDEIIAAAQGEIMGKVRKKATPRSISNISSSKQDSGNKFQGKTYAQMKTDDEKEAYLRG